MIHINLNMIFYIHVEHSPTKTIYIKYFAKKQTTPPPNTHNDCSRNWVLMLVRMEILGEEEGFQFGFKDDRVEQCLRSCRSEFKMLLLPVPNKPYVASLDVKQHERALISQQQKHQGKY